MNDKNPLINLVSEMARQPVAPGVRALANHIRRRFQTTAQAILFYGSCLRSGDDRDGIVDLYVLVDSYQRSYQKHIWATLNKLLPPNVYYLEIPFEGRMVRAKYAVLSLDDFVKGVSPEWFHSYIWGRFAQPTALVYSRSDQVTRQIHQSLAQAVKTFTHHVLPQVPPQFTGRDLWQRGLSLSYRAELRAERSAKVIRLYNAAPEYYLAATAAALRSMAADGMPVTISGSDQYHQRLSDNAKRRNTMLWRLRVFQGKLLSALRLLKGWSTFAGGTDYILWKIKRHSGIAVELTPHLRRHPFLAVCVIGWRLYRRGAFR